MLKQMQEMQTTRVSFGLVSRIGMKTGGDNFREVVENMIELLHREDLELFAMIAKGIWKRRNGVVDGELFSHPCVISQEAAECGPPTAIP